jgi:hypothetical protein
MQYYKGQKGQYQSILCKIKAMWVIFSKHSTTQENYLHISSFIISGYLWLYLNILCCTAELKISLLPNAESVFQKNHPYLSLKFLVMTT